MEDGKPSREEAEAWLLAEKPVAGVLAWHGMPNVDRYRLVEAALLKKRADGTATEAVEDLFTEELEFLWYKLTKAEMDAIREESRIRNQA